MEKIVATDTKKNYRNTNDEYWENINRKLGTQSTIKPTFQGGGYKNSNSFLLPIVEEGGLAHLRSRFKDSFAA